MQAPVIPEFVRTLSVTGTMDPQDPRLRHGHRWLAEATWLGQVIPAGAITIRTSGSEVALDGGSNTRLQPQVPSRSQLAGRQLGPSDVYVGREHRLPGGKLLRRSFWANPFRLSACRDRAEAISKFAIHAATLPNLVEQLRSLSGRTLLCHCPMHLACHADVIIDLYRKLLPSSTAETTTLVGIPHTPVSFVRAATQVQHPFAIIAAPDLLARSAVVRATHHPSTIEHWRSDTLAFWLSRQEALRVDEEHLHAAMHPDVEGVMKSKRLFLFREMMRASGFPKADLLLHHMCVGFPVVGEMPTTGIFPLRRREASRSIEDLWRSSRSAREHILRSVVASTDAQLDRAVYNETIAEIARGWLVGPIEVQDLDSEFPLWLPARRFGLQQGSKIRVIDDYSECGQNSAVSAEETIDPSDLDAVAVSARLHMLAFAATAPPEGIGTASGKSIPFSRHPSYSTDHTLVGRLWDLSHAYRQLARAPSHASISIVCVFNPDSGLPELFKQTALAFGASSSVLSFNWAAAALLQILVVLFMVGATNFFDDFTIFESSLLAASTEHSVNSVLDLLGWSIKEMPGFSQVFTALGAEIDLSAAASGEVMIANKPSRVKEMSAAITEVLGTGFVTSRICRTLRGRLMHACGQVFNKRGGHALKIIGEIADSRAGPTRIRAEVGAALRWLRASLQTSLPRIICAAYEKPLLLFTDGSAEPARGTIVAGIGGVLLDPASGSYLYFKAFLSEKVVALFTSRGAEAIIGDVELLPVWVSLLVWAEKMRHRPVLAFIDNEGSRSILVRGYSSSFISVALAHLALEEEAACGCKFWFARVSSEGNVADAPSRGACPVHLEGFLTPTESPIRCDNRTGPAAWSAIARRITEALRGSE